MQEQRFLSELSGSLSQAGLPAGYIRRALEELSDHLDDLAAEGLSADRLGSVEQLGRSIVAGYRQSSFVGSHPWVASVLALACAPLLWLAFDCASSLTAELLSSTGALGASPPSAPGGPGLLAGTLSLAPFLVVATLTGLWMARSGRGALPVALICVAQGLIALHYASSFQLPAAAGQHSLISVGLLPLGAALGPGQSAPLETALLRLLGTGIGGWAAARRMLSGGLMVRPPG